MADRKIVKTSLFKKFLVKIFENFFSTVFKWNLFDGIFLKSWKIYHLEKISNQQQAYIRKKGN